MFIAERQGFEPREPLSSTVFKTAAIDHSATSPICQICFETWLLTVVVSITGAKVGIFFISPNIWTFFSYFLVLFSFKNFK